MFCVLSGEDTAILKNDPVLVVSSKVSVAVIVLTRSVWPVTTFQ